MKKIIIAAVSKNNKIGLNGKIPWHSKEEIEHFKKTTTGYPVFMGRKTWESIGTSLKNRLNVIITKQVLSEKTNKEGIFFNSLETALSYCQQSGYEKIFIIGGGEIYKHAIGIADELIISRMNFETDGDVVFPIIDPVIWKEISAEKFTDFTVHCYIRNQV